MNFTALSPDRYQKFFAGALCLLCVISGVMPRALTILPAMLALIAFFVYRRAYGHWSKIYWPAFVWIGILFALMMVTTLWAVDSSSALERTLKTLPILFGGSLLFSMTRLADGIYFRAQFPFALLAACLICVTQFYAGAPFYYLVHPDLGAAYAGNLFYLNRETSLLVMMTPLALTCIIAGSGPRGLKAALAALLILMLGAMLYKTDSQSAQLAFVVATLFYCLFPVRLKAAWAMLIGMLIAGLFLVPWLVQWMYHNIPAMAGDNSFLQHSYALQRLEVWDFVARRALQNPLFGYGVEATDAIQDFDSAMLYHHSNKATHPHNFTLQLWIEFGIFGPLFAAAFFTVLLRGAQKMEPVFSRAAVAVLFAALSVASTGYGLWQGMWIGAFGLLISFCALAVSPHK